MILPCYLVRDLLPLYHDKLCAPDTARDVSEHLKGCESCRAALEAMDIPGRLSVPEDTDRQRAQALQMLQRKLVRTRVLTVVISALAVLLLLTVGLYGARAYFSRQYLNADPYALHLSRENGFLCLSADSGVKANCTSATVCEYGGQTVVVFSVYGSVWDGWFGSSLPSGGVDLVRNEEVTAAYYLPYEDYRALFDLSGIGTEPVLTDGQELTALPSDAVLLWQAG